MRPQGVNSAGFKIDPSVVGPRPPSHFQARTQKTRSTTSTGLDLPLRISELARHPFRGKRPGKARLHGLEIRRVLLGPPLSGRVASIPFVEVQTHVNVAVGLVIGPNATPEQIDGRNSGSGLDPLGEDFRQRLQVIGRSRGLTLTGFLRFNLFAFGFDQRKERLLIQRVGSRSASTRATTAALGVSNSTRAHPDWVELGCALDSLIGACPFRKTGSHFSGTCASLYSSSQY